MGKIPVLESELVKYIGLPIDLVFKKLEPSASNLFITECINKFREWYRDIGWYENHLYDGIENVLQTLDKKIIDLRSAPQDEPI